MKFYEKMSPIDRKIMLLKAVRYSVAMEGMQKASENFARKISVLEQKKANGTVMAASDQTNK